MGQGLRQRKWWWSIFLWGLDVAIVNSYLLYKSWYEMHGLKPMSHYSFREQIALAWLDEEKYWPKRYSRRPRTSSASSQSRKKQTVSTTSSGRVTRSIASSSIASSTAKYCKTLNQSALVNGSFDKRLVLSDEFTHLPAPALSKYSECQLHKWSDKRTRKQIAYCADYNVCLCIQCYKAFHTVVDLRRVKNDIQDDQQIFVIATTEEPSPLSELTAV